MNEEIFHVSDAKIYSRYFEIAMYFVHVVLSWYLLCTPTLSSVLPLPSPPERYVRGSLCREDMEEALLCAAGRKRRQQVQDMLEAIDAEVRLISHLRFVDSCCC